MDVNFSLVLLVLRGKFPKEYFASVCIFFNEAERLKMVSDNLFSSLLLEQYKNVFTQFHAVLKVPHTLQY